MSSANLDRILDEVRTLTPDEQKSLRDMVDELLVRGAPEMRAVEFEQRLLEKGIISRIPPRIRDASFYANRRAVKVDGKPVSETIIEERR